MVSYRTAFWAVYRIPSSNSVYAGQLGDVYSVEFIERRRPVADRSCNYRGYLSDRMSP